MTIIKIGNRGKARNFNFKCTECGTEFIARKDEMFVEEFKGVMRLFINCPVCNDRLILFKNGVEFRN